MYDYDYYDDEGWSEEEYQDYESIWDSIRP